MGKVVLRVILWHFQSRPLPKVTNVSVNYRQGRNVALGNPRSAPAFIGNQYCLCVKMMLFLRGLSIPFWTDEVVNFENSPIRYNCRDMVVEGGWRVLNLDAELFTQLLDFGLITLDNEALPLFCPNVGFQLCTCIRNEQFLAHKAVSVLICQNCHKNVLHT